MAEQWEENLSALMDDEAGKGAGFLLQRIARDESMRADWERYHLIGAAVSGSFDGPWKPDFADGVMAAIEAEPAAGIGTRVGGRVRRAVNAAAKPVAGLAIAAGVAAVAITYWPAGISPDTTVPAVADVGAPSATGSTVAANDPAFSDTTPALQTTPVALAAPPASAAIAAEEPRAQWRLAGPEAQQRLNSYLINHAEYGGRSTEIGMSPYARMVSYDTAQASNE